MALLDKLKAVVKVIQEPQQTPSQPQAQNGCKSCPRCGALLQAEERYCGRCGADTLQASFAAPIPQPQIRPLEQQKNEPLRKCPNCGEQLSGSEKSCPACGFELQSGKEISAVTALSMQLASAMTEAQRIALVKTFPVPNKKEDISEFMILASSNFDAAYHAAHADEEDISDAWLSKIEQCYQKAHVVFKNDAEFSDIDKTYKEIQKRIKKSDAENAAISEKSSWKAIFINRQKRKTREFKVALIAMIVMLAVLTITLITCGLLGVFDEEDPYADDPNAIRLGYSPTDLKGQYYQDVVELLESKGFTNVEAREDGWNLFKDEGTVKEVTVDGKTDYRDSSKYPPDVKIIIFYYE